jgi:hypothetical protein
MKLPATKCPYCAQKRDGATQLYDARTGDAARKDRQPTAGDFTMCLECGGICVFTDDGALRMLDEDVDRAALEANPALAAKIHLAQRAWEKANPDKP